ncbi:MAG: hypothetical protein K0R60_29 [Microbacterium sp.]|jgi:hypothetical protein|nr:hypothetical protein [Microbacterium sp.]
MADRKIRIGFLRYRDADGKPQLGFHGEDVDVHEDDLERFDALNPEEPEVAADSDADDESDEPTFSRADIDAAVQAAVDAKLAELDEAGLLLKQADVVDVELPKATDPVAEIEAFAKRFSIDISAGKNREEKVAEIERVVAERTAAAEATGVLQ